MLELGLLNIHEKLKKYYSDFYLYEIEDAPHGFSGDHFNEANVQIIKYLKEINVIK